MYRAETITKSLTIGLDIMRKHSVGPKMLVERPKPMNNLLMNFEKEKKIKRNGKTNDVMGRLSNMLCFIQT